MAKPATPAILAYSTEVPPTHRLPSTTYRVTLVVDRHDGRPLTETELATIEACYPQPGAKARPRAKKPAKPRSKTPKRSAAKRPRRG